jgi:Domain of unknown function DUF1828
MTECSTLLSAVLAGERSRWTCREVSSDTVLLVTSRHYADGDTVELIVQTVGDEVIVSDGGEVLARLDNVGVTVDSRTRVGTSWKRLMAAHALEDLRRSRRTAAGSGGHGGTSPEGLNAPHYPAEMTADRAPWSTAPVPGGVTGATETHWENAR